MNIRIAPTTIIMFFLFPAIRAQDMVKPITKSIQPVIKDTAKSHKKHFINMPKYARSGYIAIMGGLGMPIAAFAANKGAATGGVFSIRAAFPGIISHCGIAFKFDYGINGFNQTRLLNILNDNAGFSNIVCSLPNGSGYCSYTTLLTGLYLTYPKKHVTIDVRVLMGTMLATIPALTVNYYDETIGNNGNLYEHAASGAAFAIDFGIEARYPVKPKFSVILSADYLRAAPSFTNITTGVTLNSVGSIIQGTGQEKITDQPFNIINFALGVGYNISAQKSSVPKIN